MGNEFCCQACLLPSWETSFVVRLVRYRRGKQVLLSGLFAAVVGNEFCCQVCLLPSWETSFVIRLVCYRCGKQVLLSGLFNTTVGDKFFLYTGHIRSFLYNFIQKER